MLIKGISLFDNMHNDYPCIYQLLGALLWQNICTIVYHSFSLYLALESRCYLPAICVCFCFEGRDCL